ncbi:MAG: hotdog fold thioesterase [Bacteroidota bacterium]|nr:hotdog fold thioesterase [Candidatus Kapabacteria bacterium]MDW8219494.1 hotdog fold thioesterase [Bacteroidota bacterium]
MWHIKPTLEDINRMSCNTMVEHLGIVVTAIGDDYLEATMPVDKRTHQPMGILHGGASVALAETLGSFAAYLCVDPAEKVCVGLEINANHIRSVREGIVRGRATPRHIGRTTQVWDITITNDEGKLVCISRLTVQVMDRVR